MPSAGQPPMQVPGAQLCYTHTEPITAPSEAYTCPCGKEGSVVSVMIPRTEYLTFCELEVYGIPVSSKLLLSICLKTVLSWP